MHLHEGPMNENDKMESFLKKSSIVQRNSIIYLNLYIQDHIPYPPGIHFDTGTSITSIHYKELGEQQCSSTEVFKDSP